MNESELKMQLVQALLTLAGYMDRQNWDGVQKVSQIIYSLGSDLEVLEAYAVERDAEVNA